MNFLKIKLLVIAVIMLASSSAFASFSYNVAIDTSSLATTAGALDFQFNPGSNTLGDATATISNFYTDGSLLAAYPTGDVTGTLPTTVVIGNTTGYNDFFQTKTFGSKVSFDLNLSGKAGSLFSFYIFSNTDGTSAALTKDSANGIAFTIETNQDGTATVVNNSAQTAITPTPIPAAIYLLGSGLMGLVGLRRRKQK